MTLRIPDNLRKDLNEIREKWGIPGSDFVRESLKKCGLGTLAAINSPALRKGRI
jgi:hypothetical protein